MSAVVLDAWALLAMLQGVCGAAEVAAAYADARIAAVDYAEVVSHIIRVGMLAEEVDDARPGAGRDARQGLGADRRTLRATRPAPGLSLGRFAGLDRDPALKDFADAAQVKVVAVC
jgi:ribonuclease VapC